MEESMKQTLLIALLYGLSAGIGYAQTPAATPSTPQVPATQSSTCKSQAAEKKLAGAALSSFLKKCQADATALCNTAAADKKLAGAAKASFTKKCVSDAVGT
jgi:hypothetical protein